MHAHFQDLFCISFFLIRPAFIPQQLFILHLKTTKLLDQMSVEAEGSPCFSRFPLTRQMLRALIWSLFCSLCCSIFEDRGVQGILQLLCQGSCLGAIFIIDITAINLNVFSLPIQVVKLHNSVPTAILELCFLC